MEDQEGNVTSIASHKTESEAAIKALSQEMDLINVRAQAKHKEFTESLHPHAVARRRLELFDASITGDPTADQQKKRAELAATATSLYQETKRIEAEYNALSRQWGKLGKEFKRLTGQVVHMDRIAKREE